jgi:hypothetical protein
MDADASIFRPLVEDVESMWKHVEVHRKNIGHELNEGEKALAEKQIADLKAAPRRYREAIVKSIAVNC